MKWKFIEGSGDLLIKIGRHSVSHVVETRTYGLMSVVIWWGELDNDLFFKMTLVEGVLSMAVGDREMLLNFDIRPVSMMEDEQLTPPMEVGQNLDKSPIVDILSSLMRPSAIPRLMREVKFEDIMSILDWKFTSDDVEVYVMETPLTSRYDTNNLSFFK
jgi:hypothetical protein